MRVLAIAAVAALLAGPAGAADIVAPSRVDSVTVYPDGASVTRRLTIDLPAGGSTVIVKGLPPSIDAASLRIAGEGTVAFTIGSVEVRSVPGDPRPAVDPILEDKLKGLRERRDVTAARMEATERRRAMIRRYAEATPEKLSDDAKPMDASQWPGAWNAVGEALVKVNEEVRVLAAELRGLDEEINALERARPTARQPGAPKFDVAIALEAPAAASAALSLTYRVGGAQWRPLYDARLDTAAKDKKAAIELVRRAEIVQRTGEPWTDITLAVSTVRVARGTAAPDLPTSNVAFRAPVYRRDSASGVPMDQAPRPAPAPTTAEEKRAAPPPPPPREPAQEQQAHLDAGVFQASFTVPGRVTIPADGSPKAFRISAMTAEPELTLKTVPVLDPTAYLEASFVNKEDAPLLPGQVAIHRDGIFVGRGMLKLVAPGDKVTLAFGADDRVKVTRVPVNFRNEEPGFLGSNRTSLREFKTTVKNLHPFAVKITVVDRIPVSNDSTITVETLQQTTAPTEKVVDDKRGVMSWTWDYAAGEQKEIKLAYRLKWPADRDIVEGGGPR
ncbi:MAG: mucoidy inhibitor MuiA family protein [Alphaproteobacteria bacterium]|nr:mucoidy inhibitor MuiA family protein [Alphaproteobacteria bacterium]